MPNLSTFGANALANGTGIPATLWVQLHIGNPGAAGTANVATTSSRRSFTRTTATVGVNSNVALLEWLSASASEDLTHLSIHSATSAGDCWFVDNLTGSPISAISGQAIEIALGVLTFTFPIWS